MKKFLSIAVALVIVTMLSSCAGTFPHCTTSAPIGEKVGESSTAVWFGVFYTNKNFGVNEAAKNGGIRGGVSIVDQKTTNVLIFQKRKFIVYGS